YPWAPTLRGPTVPTLGRSGPPRFIAMTRAIDSGAALRDKTVMRSPSAAAAARCKRRGAWLGLLVVASLAYGCSSATSPERKLQAAETAWDTRGGTGCMDGRGVLSTTAGERPASIDTLVYMTQATTAALKRNQ